MVRSLCRTARASPPIRSIHPRASASFAFAGDSEPGAATRDTIGDFLGISDGGGDRIDLSALSDTLTFHDDGLFHGSAGDLRFYESASGDTFVEADLDGDLKADFQLVVRGVHELVEGDFLFGALSGA